MNIENLPVRKSIFHISTKLVEPIIEKHGLKEYKMGAAAFVSGSTVTPAEQHIDLILRVANWILEETGDCSMVQ